MFIVSAFLSCFAHPCFRPPCGGRSGGGPLRGHSGASSLGALGAPGTPGGVSSSLLASTVSSRARQRSNSFGEGFGSSSIGSNSRICGQYRSSFSTSSCACVRGSLLACRAAQGPPGGLPKGPAGGTPGRHQAQQRDWRLPPGEYSCNWKHPLRQHGAAVPL